MSIWKKPWFIPVVLTLMILVAGQLYTKGKLTKAETLTAEEIESQLEQIYNGEVSGILLDGEVYTAKVSRTGAEYAVSVDAESGKVLSLVQTKETAKPDIAQIGEEPPASEEPESVPADEKHEETDQTKSEAGKSTTTPTEKLKSEPQKTGTQTDKKPVNKQTPPQKKQNTVLISENKAASIGLSQLSNGLVGEVDDVDFVKTEEGGYYLVQIDIDTEDDMDEVTYQIHAITGKVMSVTWDD